MFCCWPNLKSGLGVGMGRKLLKSSWLLSCFLKEKVTWRKEEGGDIPGKANNARRGSLAALGSCQGFVLAEFRMPQGYNRSWAEQVGVQGTHPERPLMHPKDSNFIPETWWSPYALQTEAWAQQTCPSRTLTVAPAGGTTDLRVSGKSQ